MGTVGIVILCLLMLVIGFCVGEMVDFDWKAYFEYKTKHDERIYKAIYGEDGE